MRDFLLPRKKLCFIYYLEKKLLMSHKVIQFFIVMNIEIVNQYRFISCSIVLKIIIEEKLSLRQYER